MPLQIRHNDSGNVTVEFIAIVIGLLIPLLNVAIASVAVAQSYVVQESAARTGARILSISASFSPDAAKRAIKAVIKENHIPLNQVSVYVSCSTVACEDSNSLIQVSVHRSYRIELFGLVSRTLSIQTRQTLERGVG